mmetsp:Transcript_15835/g.42191  ORF Transcript_15835/g.42191 Transcript_15835/m.42191 type:complete len:211 (+) Transcript_15835:232-864(+)
MQRAQHGDDRLAAPRHSRTGSADGSSKHDVPRADQHLLPDADEHPQREGGEQHQQHRRQAVPRHARQLRGHWRLREERQRHGGQHHHGQAGGTQARHREVAQGGHRRADDQAGVQEVGGPDGARLLGGGLGGPTLSVRPPRQRGHPVRDALQGAPPAPLQGRGEVGPGGPRTGEDPRVDLLRGLVAQDHGAPAGLGHLRRRLHLVAEHRV